MRRRRRRKLPTKLETAVFLGVILCMLLWVEWVARH